VFETNNDETRSRFFFPLRTNVEYFRSEGNYLDLKARAKQSLLLYDEVVFQAGVYWNVMGPKGQFDMIRPFNPKKDKSVEFSDVSTAPHFFLRIRPTGASPDTPFTTLMSSEKKYEFHAQFHHLVEEMRSNGIEDVITADFGLTNSLKGLANNITKVDIKALEYDPGNPFLRKSIIGNLNFDLLLMSLINLPASIDGLHAPILAEKTLENPSVSPVPGFFSLDSVVPYVGNITWQEIAELRQEPSIVEFRRRMVKLEETVRSNIGEATEEEFREHIMLLHRDDLLEEMRGLVPTKDDIVTNVVLEVAGNIIPPVGITKSVLEAYDDVKEFVEYRRSWYAILMRIQEMKN